jgi:hypothetical protein
MKLNKKILSFLLLLALSFVIIGCDGTSTNDTEDVTTETQATEEITETPTTEEVVTTEEPTTVDKSQFSTEELLEYELSVLNVTVDKLLETGELPSSNKEWTVQFYWTSSHPSVISNDGVITRPQIGSEPVTVTLTVEARPFGSLQGQSKSFELLVEPFSGVEISEKRNYQFTGLSEEYVVEDNAEVPLYFTDGGEIPYIDIESYFELADGAVQYDLMNFEMIENDVMRISYSYTYTDYDGVTEITEEYYALIDFTENEFTVNNFDFFAGYIAETESDYGEGLNYVDADFIEGQSVTIPLSFYSIDVLTYDDGGQTQYLMPLYLANIFFMSDIYYQIYFNGDQLYGLDTFSLSDGDTTVMSQVHDSSYNNKDMPTEVKRATYNSLALIMDYFYGLKVDKNYTTYYDKIAPYKNKMIYGTDTDLYNRIYDLMYAIDDLHTSHVMFGYYGTATTRGLSIDDIAPETMEFYEGLWDVQDLLTEKFGTDDDGNIDIPEYSLINGGTVAVIHITGFTIDTPDEFKVIMDELPASVSDVVIDLSYNTGGNIGAVMRIFGYMTEDQYTYHSKNPQDGSAVTYYIESDYVAYNYDWYVLTSSVTFSAANMFASMAKELGIPVVGQKSSGGASSIGSFTTPDGSVIMISTNNVLSTRRSGVYISVESGVNVDYLMSDVTSDSELIAAINSTK